jgi:3-isopropylmalate/(R)-2-methylmalate dehydratase small subunit
MAELFNRYDRATGPYRVTVDLERCALSDQAGLEVAFQLDSYRRDMLLKGLDEIGRTLLAEEAIATHERGRARRLAGVGE